MHGSVILCLTTRFLAAVLCCCCCGVITAYEPTWESLDARPLPKWYDESKFGIFIHWGVFSVPAFRTEWFWWVWKGGYDGKSNTPHQRAEFGKFVNDSEPPRFAYQDYAKRFDALLYQPKEWAGVFAKSGAQYVVLTSKHHEGFCNWDSRDVPTTWNWNAMDVGPRRDLVGDLAREVKNATSPQTKRALRLGLYHSLFEWFNPMYMSDRENDFATTAFPDSKTIPELYDLVEKYEPEIIWSDGYGGGHSDYWKATEFLAWYATNSTVAETGIWNDRWGRDAICKHGSYLTCRDSFRPSGLQPYKWENCYTIDDSSWGYNRMSRYEDYRTTESLVHLLVETVALNGNLLLNVGPRADGTLPPIFVDRLIGIGEWLAVNGPAIYGSKPWHECQNETASSIFYTTNQKSRTLYATVTRWPRDNTLRLACPVATASTEIRVLGVAEDEGTVVSWDVLDDESGGRNKPPNKGIRVDLPALTPATIPCRHAWVVALTGIGNFEKTTTKVKRG